MGLKKAFITAQYDDPNGDLGNRWKDGKTEIVLKPNDPPTAGKWDTTRGSDVDSGGGSDHATYIWDHVNKVVNLKIGGYQGDTTNKTVVALSRFNDYKLGAKGEGVFYFRNKGVPITWELTVMEY